MIPKKTIKILKSTGVILALLSIVYTSIQIISYFKQTSTKIEASFIYYDLLEISPKREVFPFVSDFQKRITILNKYLKTPIPVIEDYNLDSININKVEEIESVF